MIGLKVKDLSFQYPDRTQVLNGINFQIEPGGRVGLLGPNGAGKTTLLLHLNGILRATSGTIQVGDLTLSDEVLGKVRRLVGFVFQDPDDQLFMATVNEDVAFGPANFGFDRTEVDRRVAAALEAAGQSDLGPRAPHHLPFVLELCPRSLIMDQGRIVADGETAQLLADRALLARHRLELPYGFDPANIAHR